ncbi:MAG TPA: DUF2333 family protein [Magnetospirillum sp.]|jgi:hypothetical protein|nr:DUF2333 family protein [Magnetospirillum sp.]
MTDQMSPPSRAFSLPAAALERLRGLARPAWWWLAPAVGLALVGYVVIGMAVTHVIDDDFDYGPGTVDSAQSRAVAIAARLVFREIEEHPWVANDPFYLPTWWLDNMPNFQQGIVSACAHFARALAEVSDRGQGPDANLERAAGLLKYPGNIWKFDPSTSWSPTASSEKQYRNAARNLVEFNQHLAAGEPGFDRHAATLAALVAALGRDLGAASADIDRHLAENHSALFDTKADDVFYATKGKVYAYGLLLRELGGDYAQVLSERELAVAWRQMVDSLKAAAALEPAVVLNGAPDGLLIPSHLTTQGFYLLRARAQLSEIAEKLAR